jgi:S1-C subfamily serine protease
MTWRLKFAALPLAFCLAAPLAAQESFRGVTDQVNKKLVKLYGAGGFKSLASYGTGIVVSPRGHILTVNNHLLDTRDLRVHLHDGRKFHAQVIAKEPALDVALVLIDDYKNDDLPCFDIPSESQKPQAEAGDWVLAFSNQFKIASREEPMSVQRGTVSAYCKLHGRRGVHDAPFQGEVYFIDAITNNPGAAGGPLTTRKGELLGIIGRELRNRLSDTWINYAVPIQAKADITREGKKASVDIPFFVQEAMKGKYKQSDLKKKKSGVGVYTGIVLVPNVVERCPPYVEEVVPDSPAAKAGLKPDDLIVYMNGELVSTINIFNDYLNNYHPGEEIQLEVQRGTELVGVKLMLAKPKTGKSK